MQKFLRKLSMASMVLLTIAPMTVVKAATLIDLNRKDATRLHAINTIPAEFTETSRAVDANQTTHIRIQQTYTGYRVWGGDAVIHTHSSSANLHALLTATKNNSFTVNGTLYQGLEPDLANAPAYIFNAAQADKALQQTMQYYYAKSGTKNLPTRQQEELLVYVDDDSKAHWAFLISFVSAPTGAMPEKPTYLVDALTFTIYESWNDVKTLQDVDGGGFGGNPKMGKLIYDAIGADLPKLSLQRNADKDLCYVENKEVSVEDWRKNDAVVQFKCLAPDQEHNEYWDADLDAINGSYSPSNDALYAGKIIKSMYEDWYQVPVLVDASGKPMLLIMRVHDDSFDGKENAYWFDGSMTFGDGGEMFYPLVSLGVAAHEISHGFTEQHSKLKYIGQSGGLDEAFSDMAAQAAEYYSSKHSSWQIGSEILKTDGSLRYLDEPTKDCKGGKPGVKCSISNFKDYYSGLDVHYSSGIFNKLFYLLSTTKDWNTRKAFDVMVQANMNYWTPNVTFANAACGAISAAKDRGYDVEAVKTAALGVGIYTANCA